MKKVTNTNLNHEKKNAFSILSQSYIENTEHILECLNNFLSYKASFLLVS